MKKYKIFVSGNQKELKKERTAVKEIVLGNQTLRDLFDIFLFEDLPAKGESPVLTYLKEVDNSDIYLGMVGYKYGQKGKDGLSATEREYKRFIKRKRPKDVLIFIKGKSGVDKKRDKDTQRFLRSIRNSYVYDRFTTMESLKTKALNSLISYLDDEGLLAKVPFDQTVCREARLKDIDKEKVKSFLKKAKTERGLGISPDLPTKEILMRLKLIREGKLTNSAVLLFSNNPQDFFIQAEIKCVRFKGIDVTGTMTDMKPISGNLIDQVVEAEKFIYDRISMSAWIESGKIERQEKWEYPPKAIREALVNAIAHRDYQSSSKVQVRIFDDRMEFWNPGRLPEGWTVETLKQKHESKPYNPLIARAFFWIKYIEEVGTGTNKIIQWCKEWGLPEPDFEYTGTSLVVTLRKSKLTEEYLESLDLSDKEKGIVNHIKIHKKVTSGEIQRMFNVSRDTANRYLKRLIDSRIVERQGVGKAIYYILRLK